MKIITFCVVITQTSSKKAGERLAFYVKYIQPIKEYFKID